MYAVAYVPNLANLASAGLCLFVYIPNQNPARLMRPREYRSSMGLRATILMCSTPFPDVFAPRGHPSACDVYARDHGSAGVSVLFAISGFLIAILLMRKRQTFTEVSLSDFSIRRSFRILPAFAMYLGAVALLAGFHWISVRRTEFLHALTFTTDYDSHTNWFLGHAWSLSVEEQCYLVCPLWPFFIKTGR